MATLYGNLLGGTITDAPLTLAATSANSSAFSLLPEVAGGDVMYMTLDPEGVNGAPEIVKVTAHTAAATTVTIVRAEQDTTAREHPAATVWKHGLTATDVDDFKARGVVARATSTTSSASVAVETDVPDLTVTWDAVVSRVYKISATVPMSAKTASEDIVVKVTDELNAATPISVYLYDPATSTTAVLLGYETDLSGSVTRKLRFDSAGAGLVQAVSSATRAGYLIVEDIGPA